MLGSSEKTLDIEKALFKMKIYLAKKNLKKVIN